MGRHCCASEAAGALGVAHEKGECMSMFVCDIMSVEGDVMGGV